MGVEGIQRESPPDQSQTFPDIFSVCFLVLLFLRLFLPLNYALSLILLRFL